MVGEPGYYRVRHSVEALEALATDMRVSPGTIVTSDEAAVVRKKVWAEIISVLRDVDPELQTKF